MTMCTCALSKCIMHCAGSGEGLVYPQTVHKSSAQSDPKAQV